MKTHKNISKTFGALLAVVCLAYAVTAQATVIGDFETDLSGWTNAGGWVGGVAPGFANSDLNYANDLGGGSAGTLTSPNFTIDEKTLQFKVYGYGKNQNTMLTPGTGGALGEGVFSASSQTWRLVRDSDSAVLARGTPAGTQNNGTIQFEDFTILTDRYIGQTVRLEVTSTSSFSRDIGIDQVHTVNIDGTNPNARTAFTVDVADQSGWTKDNTVFDFSTAQNPEFNVGNIHPRTGGELIRSFDGTATGSRNRPPFSSIGNFLNSTVPVGGMPQVIVRPTCEFI